MMLPRYSTTPSSSNPGSQKEYTRYRSPGTIQPRQPSRNNGPRDKIGTIETGLENLNYSPHYEAHSSHSASKRYSPVRSRNPSVPVVPPAPGPSSYGHRQSSAQSGGPQTQGRFTRRNTLGPLSAFPTSGANNTPRVPAPFTRNVNTYEELVPIVHKTPKYRRATYEGIYLSPLQSLTANINDTFQLCNPNFTYSSTRNPRRALTKPSTPKLNNGWDNENNDYILFVNDILGTQQSTKYLVLDILGHGTFGQVVKTQNMKTKKIVATKIIKAKKAYLNQSLMEVAILEQINRKVDPKDEHHFLKLLDRFIHKEHLCLVFELLSCNLYELIKQNQFKGLNIKLIRCFTTQLLDSLAVLKDAKLIHCDLKPENILLIQQDKPMLKIIDFGSACHERQTVYTYIQSRFYRAPEILLGIPYTCSIDMWSLGCIVAELFLGLPIFPGQSEYNQLSRIIEALGLPPHWMLEMGKNSSRFFTKLKYKSSTGVIKDGFQLKSLDAFNNEYGSNERQSKKYFSQTKLKELIINYVPRTFGSSSNKSSAVSSATNPNTNPNTNYNNTSNTNGNNSSSISESEMKQRYILLDFLSGLLQINPLQRWTPHQAMKHPFITGQEFKGSYKPSSTYHSSKKENDIVGIPHDPPRKIRASRSNGEINGFYQAQAQLQAQFPPPQVLQQQRSGGKVSHGVGSTTSTPYLKDRYKNSHSTNSGKYISDFNDYDYNNYEMPKAPSLAKGYQYGNMIASPKTTQTVTSMNVNTNMNGNSNGNVVNSNGSGRQRARTIGQDSVPQAFQKVYQKQHNQAAHQNQTSQRDQTKQHGQPRVSGV